MTYLSIERVDSLRLQRYDVVFVEEMFRVLYLDKLLELRCAHFLNSMVIFIFEEKDKT